MSELPELPYMPEVIESVMAETVHLSNEELGAFMRIRWALWRAGGFLVDDSRQLARIARAGSRWGRIAPAIVALLTIAGGKISNTPLLRALLITRERRANFVKAGRARHAKPDIGLNPSKPLELLNPPPETLAKCSQHSASNYNYKKKDITSSEQEAARARLVEVPKGASEEAAAKSIAPSPELSRLLLEQAVTERGNLALLPAQGKVESWIKVLGDIGEVARIVAEFDQHNFRGQSFVDQVTARVSARAEELACGRTIPGLLGPQVPNEIARRLAARKKGSAA